MVQNGLVSSTFPRTRRSRRGYDVDQVEDFLEEARNAYSAESDSPAALTSAAIRHTAFSLQRGGYSPSHVDAALERLEDAFASRERDRARATAGDEVWFTEARGTAKQIIDRLARPKGKRFRRAGFLSEGYDPKKVDAFGSRLADYFLKGTPMSVESVRMVAFPSKKGGYQEAQVDVFLDTVVEVMLAVR